METMIRNLINGNLSDAKKQAKRFGMGKIFSFCRHIGWAENKAMAAAVYLKSPCQVTFDKFCKYV